MPKSSEKYARLFRNGRSQAVRIPKEFEFPGTEVLVRKEGERLILEPVRGKPGLLELLASLKPTDVTLPDVDSDLLPLDDVRL